MTKKALLDIIGNLPDDAEIYISCNLFDVYDDEYYDQVGTCATVSIDTVVEGPDTGKVSIILKSCPDFEGYNNL